jgi:pilus assembly protein CpaF
VWKEVREIIAPLEPILSDERIGEIMIDHHERVLVARDEGVEQVPSPFASAQELRTMIDCLFGLYGVQLDAAHPVGYLRLPDQSRVTAVLPPNAVDGPYLVLRRIAGPRMTWDMLFTYGAVPRGAYDLLRRAVQARVNILVSGGTASGKTTVANLIAEMCGPEERLILVEEVYGMRVQHPRAIRLEAGGPAGLTFEDVLTAATRMRPDRLIVGEISGPVVASVLQWFGSGYDGSLANVHSRSIEDALSRLESYCLMANLGLGLGEIRQLIAAGIQLITYQERLPDGSRKLAEMVELRGVENHRYVLQPLMRYHRETGVFEFTGIEPSWER